MRRDLLPQDPQLDVYRRAGRTDIEYCNGNRVTFEGLPNITPSPNGLQAMVSGISLGNKQYVIWECAAYAYDEVEIFYGFLRGQPLLVGYRDGAKYLQWGNVYQTGPLADVKVNWYFSFLVDQPFYTARLEDGSSIIGIGVLQHGPFNTLSDPLFDPRDNSVVVRGIIGNTIVVFTFRTAKWKAAHFFSTEILPEDF